MGGGRILIHWRVALNGNSVIEPLLKSFLGPTAAAVWQMIERDLDADFFEKWQAVAGSQLEAPAFSTNKRKQEWAAGRRALLNLHEVLQSAGIAPAARIFSLSHSGEMVLAVACEKSAQVKKIGVDIESADRVLTTQVAEKFVDREEQQWGLSALQLWTIKEAAFKANPKSEDTYVSQYILKDWDANKQRGCVSCGSTELRVQVWQEGAFMGAFASAK